MIERDDGRPLRVLEELGAEFARVDREQARPRYRWAPRSVPVAVALTLLLTGAAAAATIWIVTGGSIPPAAKRDVPPELTPRPGTARLGGLNAPDPAGGPSWDLRMSRSQTGQICSAVGQVVQGKFGIVGLDRRFRTLALRGVDSCGQRLKGEPSLVGARVFAGRTNADARTVVNGVAGDSVRRVVARGPDGARRLRVGPGGAFLTVYQGYVEDVRPRVTVTYVNGHSRTIAFADSEFYETADPDGGPHWTLDVSRRRGGARAGQTCVQFLRTRDRRPSMGTFGPPRCGDLRVDQVWFDVRRFVPSKARGPFPWGLAPARVVVWGAAGPKVRAVSVEGPDGTRRLALSRTGRGFLAVYPGQLDPQRLRVVVTLRDGTTHRFTGAQNVRTASGERRGPVASPPYRPLPPPEQRAFKNPSPPIPGSERIKARTPNGGAGADWALRVWRARSTSRPGAFWCAQLGRLVDGRFGLPGGGAWRPDFAFFGTCAGPRSGPLAQFETYVAAPRAYAPRPLRTVVWGVAGPGVAHATVEGLGGSRPLRLSPRGAFLALYPGSVRQRGLSVRLVYRNGTIRDLHARQGGLAAAGRIEARAPDPDGAAPWGLKVSGSGSRLCYSHGRIVAGRLGNLDITGGRFLDSARGGGCGLPPLRRSDPIALGIAGQTGFEERPSRGAQIARRTLPGRTIIMGITRPDVALVTIQTPRDVRTLRPSLRSHAFIAVYDGEFFRGEFVLTAKFTDGTRIVHTYPIRSH